MSDEAKHTPGPWTYTGVAENDVLFYIESELVVIAETVDGIPPKEAEANARLIAAAPDLLEALKLCLRFAETEASQEDACYDAGPAVEKARAAITKAEGGAQ